MATSKEISIRPPSGWMTDGQIRELWQYRDLIKLLVRRDFLARYRQTILGPLWFIIQPLLFAIVFTLVFGKVIKVPTEGPHPTLFYLAGLLCWNFFSQNYSATSGVFLNNRELFQKVWFPRLVMPVSAILANFPAILLNLILFFFVALMLPNVGGAPFSLPDSPISWLPSPAHLLLLCIPLAGTALFSLGIGLCFSALSAAYRDLAHLSTFLLQLGLYATPVIYPFSSVPEEWRTFAALNPLTGYCEMTKSLLLGMPMPGFQLMFVGLLVTGVSLVIGLFLFRRSEQSNIDKL